MENLIGKWIECPDNTWTEIIGIAYRPAHPDYPPVQDEIVILHCFLSGREDFMSIEDLLVFHREGKVWDKHSGAKDQM